MVIFTRDLGHQLNAKNQKAVEDELTDSVACRRRARAPVINKDFLLRRMTP
jgi:hypothetical protein